MTQEKQGFEDKVEEKDELLEDRVEAKLDVVEERIEEKLGGLKASLEQAADDVEDAAESFVDTLEEIVEDFIGDDDADDHDHECGCSCGCEEHELFEIEIDEEDIVGYIYDEDDNEIGLVIHDEDGEEVELFYASGDEYEYVEEEAADAPASKKASEDDEYDLGITREGVAETTNDMNAIYKDGIHIAAEFKGAFDDISAGLNFLKKK